jgi:hypothetical protein
MDLNRHARAKKGLLDSMAGSEKDSTSPIFTAEEHANAPLVNTTTMECAQAVHRENTVHLLERIRVQTVHRVNTVHLLERIRVQTVAHAQAGSIDQDV